MPFTIRLATPQDAPQISALLAASYSVLLRGAYGEPVLAATLPLMTRANPALLSSGAYYLAEAPDALVVGAGGWTFNFPGSGKIEEGLAHLRHFAVHPHWTRKGVGRAVFNACENAARAAGARRFQCYATLNGESFYMALGFTSLRRIDVPMSESTTLPSILMERPIDA